MFGMAPQGAMPMQGWPPHMMPGGFPLDVNVTLPDAPDANQVLKLKGLPFSASARDVGVFFEDFSVVSCSIHHGSDGRPSGMVRACAHRPADWRRAHAARRMNNAELCAPFSPRPTSFFTPPTRPSAR